MILSKRHKKIYTAIIIFASLALILTSLLPVFASIFQ